jgi:Phosphopantetheine attachment site
MGRSDDDTYVPPRTPTERQLTEIFEELLGSGRVGIRDTFFDLSGFSLLATQLAARVYESFGVELTLRDVFQAPTIEGLALLVVQAQAELAGEAGLQALLAELE